MKSTAAVSHTAMSDHDNEHDTTLRHEPTRGLYGWITHTDLASANPEYKGRRFEEIEPNLQRAWGEDQTKRFGSWPEVRGFVSFGYEGKNKGQNTNTNR